MTKAAQDTDQPRKPDLIEEALSGLLAMLTRGELPEAIARTEITRRSSDAPSAAWSLGNQLLMIAAGTNDARGFRQWQAASRQVKKGARAFRILGPIAARKSRSHDTNATEEEGPSRKDEARVIVTGFKALPVFRLEDTDGEPVEVPDYAPITLPPLADVAERLGVTVRYAPRLGGYLGFYSLARKDITLCSYDERIFFHELAHAAHDHTTGGKLKGGQDSHQEIVAETAAATLCHMHGLVGYLAHSRDYIDRYANGEGAARAMMGVLSEVRAVLDLILGPPR